MHNDEYVLYAIKDFGLTGKIEFCRQPANSLDLNILDLGFSNALQTAYKCSLGINVVCILCVEKTYRVPEGEDQQDFHCFTIFATV